MVFLISSIIPVFCKPAKGLLEDLNSDDLNRLLKETPWPIKFKSKPMIRKNRMMRPQRDEGDQGVYTSPSVSPLNHLNPYRKIQFTGQTDISGSLGDVIYIVNDNILPFDHNLESTGQRSLDTHEENQIIRKGNGFTEPNYETMFKPINIPISFENYKTPHDQYTLANTGYTDTRLKGLHSHITPYFDGFAFNPTNMYSYGLHRSQNRQGNHRYRSNSFYRDYRQSKRIDTHFGSTI